MVDNDNNVNSKIYESIKRVDFKVKRIISFSLELFDKHLYYFRIVTNTSKDVFNDDGNDPDCGWLTT